MPTHDDTAAGWRAFGTPPDLDIDFRDPDRPGLVSRLLVSCRARGAAGDGDDVWAWPVAARIGGLLAVVARTLDATALAVPARCGREACKARFELELPVAPLLDLAGEAAARPVLEVRGSGRTWRLRRTTGADQRAWRTRRFASEAEAARAVVRALLVDGDERSADVAALAAEMEDFDPLPGFRVACECPTCGTAADLPLDLEAVLLERLEREQRSLADAVHRIASRYGWTEAEILSLPPRRRRGYLARIEADAEESS